MEKSDLKYDAFISYRHAELDKFVAEKLHKELEKFTLPSNLAKRVRSQEGKKTKISRVFRDRDELPIASNLAQPIVKALESSDFLIVICTPRLLESIWCKKEIETFIRLHGRERVLAVLAEGEPHESFPEAILYDENKNPVEPLAADVRGKTKKEVQKKIKEEVVRLAAPMFDCAYDELKQRHRERKLKKIVAALTIGAAVCLLFGTISTTMALRIHIQSVEIEKQAEKIEEQYTQAMKTNAKSMAADALRLLESGDRVAAIQMTLSALKMPYTPQAQYALTESLYVYENGYQILPMHTLEQEAEIGFIKLSPKRDRILINDIFGKISVWDAIENEKKCEVQINATNTNFVGEEQIVFLTNDLIAYPKESGFVVYDIIRNQEVFENMENFPGKFCVNQDGTKFSVISYNQISLFDLSNFDCLLQYVPQGEERFYYMSAFSENDEYFAFAEEKSNKIYIVDIGTKKTETIIMGDKDRITEMKFAGKEFILILEEKIEMYSVKDSVYKLWEYAGRTQRIKDIDIIQNEDKKYLVFRTYDYIGVLDYLTGNYIDGCEYAKEIIDIQPNKNSLALGVIMRDGEYHHLNLDTMLDVVLQGKFEMVSNNIKGAVQGAGFMATLEYGASKAVVYQLVRGAEWEKIYTGNSAIGNVVVNEAEKEMLFSEEDELSVFDIKKAEIKNRIKTNGIIEGISYLGEKEEHFIVVSAKEIACYETATGKKIKDISLEDSMDKFSAFIQKGKKVIFDNYREVLIYDIESEKVEHTIELQEGGFDAVYALADSAEIIAIKNKEKNKIELLSVSENEIFLEVSCKAAMVTALNIVEEEKLLYITYMDNRVVVYNYETNKELTYFEQFKDQVEKVSFEHHTGNSFLIGSQETYVLNNKKELIARIDKRQADLPKTKRLLATEGYSLYLLPFYDLERLKETAKSQIQK